MRTWQSWYETVEDGSNEGDSSHWIVLFCERFWLAGICGRDSGRRAMGGAVDEERWVVLELKWCCAICI